MICNKLLNAIHQARYLYINEDAKEIYAWHGTNEINIYNYLGDDIGKFSIINYSKDDVYKKYESINIRDVTLSIDDIVYSTYRKTNE